ncbi:MAG TPA: anti-sigma factor [Polyangiaceae bacterium]|nr:anti-sigma factor [Polyangiaceae bacterium]
MNCSDFKEQVHAWALGALEPSEAARMESHLAEAIAHEGCGALALEARLTVARLALALAPVQPSQRVWNDIAQRIGVAPASPRRAAQIRETVGYALAAAAAVALFFVHDDRARQIERADKSDQLLAEARAGLAERDRCLLELRRVEGSANWQKGAIALLEKPSTKVVALEPVAGQSYRASAIVNVADRRTIVVASAMAPEPGKDFELWLIRGKEPPKAAGLMKATAGGGAVLEIDPALLDGPFPDAFAVSREKAGGSTTGAPETVLMAGAVHG